MYSLHFNQIISMQQETCFFKKFTKHGQGKEKFVQTMRVESGGHKLMSILSKLWHQRSGQTSCLVWPGVGLGTLTIPIQTRMSQGQLWTACQTLTPRLCRTAESLPPKSPDLLGGLSAYGTLRSFRPVSGCEMEQPEPAATNASRWPSCGLLGLLAVRCGSSPFTDLEAAHLEWPVSNHSRCTASVSPLTTP